MIDVYEGIKKIMNKNKGKNYKLQKNDRKSYFVKSDTLGALDYNEVNELAERLISWYIVKIPDRLFVSNNGVLTLNKNDVNYQVFKKMTFADFIRKNHKLKYLICEYSNNDFLNNGSLIIQIYTTRGLLKNKIDKVCNILADKNSGKLLGIDGDYLFPKNLNKNYTNYSLEEMLTLIRNNPIENLNYNSLKNCVNKRNKSVKTREKIINRVCSGLLFYNEEEVDYGYYRAMAFLKDINYFLNLDLNVQYLDKIIENKKLEKTNKKSKKK